MEAVVAAEVPDAEGVAAATGVAAAVVEGELNLAAETGRTTAPSLPAVF